MRSLDVLRGIAILGTLGTNIFFWAGLPQMQDPDFFKSLSPFEALLMQMTNGKFLSLLTLMFGMGLVIQFDAAERRNQRWPHVYLWRGVLLFLDGVLHYLLVFEFDVLMSYAVTGIIVSYLLLTGRRTQRIICGIAAGLHITVVLIFDAFMLTVSERELRAFAQDQQGSMLPEDASWWDGVVYRATELLVNRMEAIMILPMSIALFLLGAFLLRAGLFEERGARLRRKLMLVGSFALLLDMALALASTAWDPLQKLQGLRRYLIPVFVALGIAAAVAAFYQSRPIGWTGRRLEDVGRLALSCYVGQNLVCMLLFTEWSVNLDARMPAQLGTGIVVISYVLVVAIIVVFASLWRRRFQRGPLEWLWARSYRGAMRMTPALSRPRRDTAHEVGAAAPGKELG